MIVPSELPIVQAPMAGGPSTPELTAAVAAAGGYGYLAGGYLAATDLAERISRLRTLTDRPFGVNLFVPAPRQDVDLGPYIAELQPESERIGVPLGEPRWDDDDYPAKLALLAEERPHSATFTFGCPTASEIEMLHGAGVLVGVTITSVAEARAAADVGADFLAAQGTEAGGHQGSFLDRRANTTPLGMLLAELRDTTALPIVAAGGLMTGADIAAVLAAGAEAAQLGTAFLDADEAGTAAVHRASLHSDAFTETVLTRAYSGRYARGLLNRFAREHSATAPEAYPQVHHLTRPLRSAAVRAGDPDVAGMWAGTGWRRVQTAAAAVIVDRLAAELQAARSGYPAVGT
ncbi:MAG: nitronate monooxygenase [Jatrophihabitans sp.]|uniref:nitronate monooxygenase n=1 Tax=Jatrophihabitans sp. TaxID=1932789 RepID=UPI003F81C9BD